MSNGRRERAKLGRDLGRFSHHFVGSLLNLAHGHVTEMIDRLNGRAGQPRPIRTYRRGR